MRLRIDGIFAMSRGFSGGKQWIKFANTNLFILSTQDDDLTVFQNVQFEFWQVLRHYYMLKGHLRSLQLPNKVTMNTFTNNLPFSVSGLISSSFSFVQNKQTRPRLLVLADFVTCLPPEKPRDIVFIPISWISIWRNVSIHHQTKHWEESSQRNIFD